MLNNFINKLNLFTLSFFFLLGSNAFGQILNQNPPPPGEFDYSVTHILHNVIFHRPSMSTSSWIRIRKDDDTDFISGESSTVAWTELEKKPIGYVSGSKARVEGNFWTSCTNPVVWIRGDGPGDYNLPKKSIPNVGGFLNYVDDLHKTFSLNKVQYWESFEIKWYISEVEDGSEELFGTSIHPLYVTHKKALPDLSFIPFHTILHIGCQSANGTIGESSIIEKVHDEFKDRKVRKVGGTVDMTYYRPPPPYLACYDTKLLLEKEDGRCGAWSDFFKDIILMQGIEVNRAAVYWDIGILSEADVSTFTTKISSFFGDEAASITPTIVTGVTGASGHIAEFFVKEWASAPENSFSISDYENSGISSLTLANGNTILDKDVTGAPGQGNENPFSEFQDHALVKYFDTYYDPSYGTKYPSQNDWENGAVSYFGTFFFYSRVEGTETKHYAISWFGHSNDGTQVTDFYEVPD